MDLNQPSTSSTPANEEVSCPPAKNIILKMKKEDEAELNQFFASGNNVTINADILQRFPIADHETQYRRIGKDTRSLTVSNISLEQAKRIFSFFGNLDTLIVRKMELIKELCRGFPPIRFLKLSQCWAKEPIFQSWLKHMVRKLESIHFDRVTTNDFRKYSMGPMDELFATDLPHLTLEKTASNHCQYYIDKYGNDLETLTILGPCEIILRDLEKLRRLTIENIRLQRNGCTYLPALKFLSIRGEFVDDMLKSIPSTLKTFECRSAPVNIENVLELKKLEHVKIHCNWYHMEKLKRHFASLPTLKSCEVTWCAPTEGKNLFHSIDEDSLRLILQNLQERDLVSVACAHPKFISFLPCLVIDPKFLEAYPLENLDLYRDFGSRVVKLSVAGHISGPQWNVIVPHFKRIRWLKLDYLVIFAHYFDYSNLDSFLDPLESDDLVSLIITSANASDCNTAFLQKWFRKFPALKTVRMETRHSEESNSYFLLLVENILRSGATREDSGMNVKRIGPETLLVSRSN